MSPRTAVAAVARGAAETVHLPTRTRTRKRPAPQRRRSGAAPARPRIGARTAPRFDGVALLDRILRGPAYIAVVGLLLAGIVFFNVDVLELNHGIARTDTRSAQLKRENATLTLQLAKLGSSERIQRMALEQGLVLPQPGDVRYLRADHRQDAARALRVMTAPDSSSAAAVVPAVVTQQSTPNSASVTQTTPTAQTTPASTSTPTTTTQATTTPTTTTTGTAAPVVSQPAANPTTAGAVAAPSTP